MLTIGADVEVFAKTKTGEHKALCGLIGGTKEEPLQIQGLPEGFKVQEDNVSVEFNIPPAQHKADFVKNIKVMNHYVQDLLKKMDYEMSNKSSFIFSKEELKHPNAKVFGCEPDYDAWKKIENKKPQAKNECLRTAGGHIHVGTNQVDMISGIRAMDLYLGVPSVLLDNSPEAVQRRELYGKAGAMRPKPYGFEYRVLSNFWMFNEQLSEWVFRATMQAMRFAENTRKELPKSVGNAIQTCINTGDKVLAEKLIKDFALPMIDKSFSLQMELTPKDFELYAKAPQMISKKTYKAYLHSNPELYNIVNNIPHYTSEEDTLALVNVYYYKKEAQRGNTLSFNPTLGINPFLTYATQNIPTTFFLQENEAPLPPQGEQE